MLLVMGWSSSSSTTCKCLCQCLCTVYTQIHILLFSIHTHTTKYLHICQCQKMCQFLKISIKVKNSISVTQGNTVYTSPSTSSCNSYPCKTTAPTNSSKGSALEGTQNIEGTDQLLFTCLVTLMSPPPPPDVFSQDTRYQE